MDTFLSVHKDNEAKQGSSQSRAPIKSHGVTPGAAGFRSQSQGVSACPLSSDIVSGMVNDIHLQCSGGIAQKKYILILYTGLDLSAVLCMLISYLRIGEPGKHGAWGRLVTLGPAFTVFMLRGL